MKQETKNLKVEGDRVHVPVLATGDEGGAVEGEEDVPAVMRGVPVAAAERVAARHTGGEAGGVVGEARWPSTN